MNLMQLSAWMTAFNRIVWRKIGSPDIPWTWATCPDDKYISFLVVTAAYFFLRIPRVFSTIHRCLSRDLAFGSWRSEFGMNSEERALFEDPNSRNSLNTNAFRSSLNENIYIAVSVTFCQTYVCSCHGIVCYGYTAYWCIFGEQAKPFDARSLVQV